MLTLSACILVTQFTSAPFLKQPEAPCIIPLAISHCQTLQLKIGPPPSFHKHTLSDCHADGTKPVLLKHMRIWTGGKNGTEVIHGDILLDKGLIKAVGHVSQSTWKVFNDN